MLQFAGIADFPELLSKDMRYRLSIVIPCYRVEPYLKRCLDALLAQNMDGIQLVCVNDGSPDNSLRILREYESRCPNVTVIDQENRGAWQARRRGIEAAEGEYIGFADPDDRVQPGFAEKLYTAAQASGADIVVCGFDRIDGETGKRCSREMTAFPYREFSLRQEPGLLLEVNTALWNKIFRTGLAKSMPEFSSAPRCFEDLFAFQLLCKNADRICFVPDSLVCYTVRKDSMMGSIRQEDIPEIRTAMLQLRGLFLYRQPGYASFPDALAFLHLGISLMHRVSGFGDTTLKKTLRENTAFLDAEFPGWRTSPFLCLSYVLRHRGANRKVFLVRQIYRLHLERFFFRVYNSMILRLGIDIKW